MIPRDVHFYSAFVYNTIHISLDNAGGKYTSWVYSRLGRFLVARLAVCITSHFNKSIILTKPTQSWQLYFSRLNILPDQMQKQDTPVILA